MKKAFTLIELVFVIVIIGILAAVIIPRMRTHPVAEAAVDLLAKIRYTQHLSIVNDKYDTSDATWFQDRWQISFATNTYSIQSENNNTYAMSTIDSTQEIKNIELKGLDNLVLSDGCSGQSIISFDYLGRPLVGSLSAITSSYVSTGNGKLLAFDTNCTIKLTNGTETSFIDIQPETGYASIRQ